jgi:hypothetical protein
MNRNLMAAIVVVLLIAVGFLIYQNGQKNATLGDKVGGTINEATEEIKDEIDDHTTTR